MIIIHQITKLYPQMNNHAIRLITSSFSWLMIGDQNPEKI